MPRPQNTPQDPAEQQPAADPPADQLEGIDPPELEGIDPDAFIDPTDADYVAAYIEAHGLEAFQAERLRQSGTKYGD